MLSSLQNIFNKLLAREKVHALFFSRREYDSARTSIIRKFRTHKESFDKIGIDNPYAGFYIKCEFDAVKVSGTFYLEEERRRSGLPGKSYNLTEL